jgi:hypothetical protein
MAKADDPNNPELTSFTLSRAWDASGAGKDSGEEATNPEQKKKEATNPQLKKMAIQGFHADLPDAGEKLDGAIWVTRHGGYAGGRKYTFALRGNQGDFELVDKTATLVRGQPVRVRFKTNGQSGWNIVFLELRDAKADVVMQDVPLSVRVPDVPEKIALGMEKYESTIPPLTTELRYVRVGEEVQVPAT